MPSSIHTNAKPELPSTASEREKEFWKSLPLSRQYRKEQIDHAASLLSAIASADYTNPIPTEPVMQRKTPVIKLPKLFPGKSVAVFNGSEWCLGVFQKLDCGMYVVLVEQQGMGCDDLTDVGDLDCDTDTEETTDGSGSILYSVRGSHMRILCESVEYEIGEQVMALFPGCETFYSASIKGRYDGKWIVKFKGDDEEQTEERAVCVRLVNPSLIFKA